MAFSSYALYKSGEYVADPQQSRNVLAKFNNLSKKVKFTRTNWLQIYSITNTIERTWNLNIEMQTKEMRKNYSPVRSVIQILDDSYEECFFEESERFVNGTIIMRDCLMFLSSICTVVFHSIYEDLKSKKKSKNFLNLTPDDEDIPVEKLKGKFLSSLKDSVKVASKGFGAKKAKSTENILSLIIPILGEKQFPLFLSLVDELIFCCLESYGALANCPDMHIDINGFKNFQVFPDDHAMYGKSDEDIDASSVSDSFVQFFEYANRMNVEKVVLKEDRMENFFALMEKFVNEVIPLYLNNTSVSSSFSYAKDKLVRKYVSYCHSSLQEKLIYSISNSFEKLFDEYELNSPKISQIEEALRTSKASLIVSACKSLDLEQNWLKLLTKGSFNLIRTDFLNLCEYFRPKSELIQNEVLEDLMDSEIEVGDESIVDSYSKIASVVVEKSKIFTDEQFYLDNSTLIDWNTANLSSSKRIFEDLIEMVYTAKNHPKKSSSILKTLMQISLTPTIFGTNRFITSKRLSFFSADFDPIQKGDLEVRVGSASRLFLRQIGDKIKIVFFGNPAYH
ncbi:MAG: hypothetical protein ACRCXZ_02070 [Patescibacteria group bacterium]